MLADKIRNHVASMSVFGRSICSLQCQTSGQLESCALLVLIMDTSEGLFHVVPTVTGGCT